MATSFRRLVDELKAVANRFDAPGNARKAALLASLSARPLPLAASLAAYADTLLFLCAYPANVALRAGAEAELHRLTERLRRARVRDRARLANRGLPFTPTRAPFSHDLLRWMVDSRRYIVTLDTLTGPPAALNEALQFTLPVAEREITTIGYSQAELFRELIGRGDRLAFLLGQFARLDAQPFLKDHLFDELGACVTIHPREATFATAGNRIAAGPVYCHAELLRRFDHRALLGRRLPGPAPLRAPARTALIAVARDALVLLRRETDPATYMDERSLRLYHLERGISVALYGLLPARQLPFESYVGYTLFKNGYPAAYGGAWVFGRRALFGINVFAPFRGGESGYVLCQLLRTYHQVFAVDHFEVEPYQYGAGNPEGLRSGAFWFYYRYGFRPLDAGLRRVASAEARRIRAEPGYRSPLATLRRFTQANMELALAAASPPRVAGLRERITQHIATRYGGDRAWAEAECRRAFRARAPDLGRLDTAQDRVLTEIALWSAAVGVRDTRRTGRLAAMVRVKPRDPYRYQALLLGLRP